MSEPLVTAELARVTLMARTIVLEEVVQGQHGHRDVRISQDRGPDKPRQTILVPGVYIELLAEALGAFLSRREGAAREARQDAVRCAPARA